MPGHTAFKRFLVHWRRLVEWLSDPSGPQTRQAPLRARLLSDEQMEQQGRVVAKAHRLSAKPGPDRLLARLRDNQKALEQACGVLTRAVQHKRLLTPAGEWLLDNIYLIEEQIGIARRHLPKGYSRELPQLAQGPSAGLPRVYDIVLNAISHGDGRIDAQSLSRYVAAYQTETPLTLGELWAIPIMLRVALIENLRRIAVRIQDDCLERNLAADWAERMTQVAESDPKSLVVVIADMARSQPPARSAFVAEFARRLQGQSSVLALPLTWVEQWLVDSHQSIERLVHVQNQQQAAAQVSVSNSIGSLRFLAMMDWREFVETLSVVDQTLRQDPAATYGAMDFATRDRYRHVVELVARRGKLSEIDVAAKVLALARSGAEGNHGEGGDGEDAITAHVGYYLVDDGRRQLERALELRGITRNLRETARRLPLLAYSGPGLAIVALFTWAMLDHVWLPHAAAWAWLAGILCVIAASELAVALVNWFATLATRPYELPRLDFSRGIPAEMRTLVVVPSMFGTIEDFQVLAEALEVRYLANRDEHLHFALLTDFFDADEQESAQDGTLLDAAQREIESLNARHGSAGNDRFFLFHRPRLWNPRERVWMGRERKRGKLAALNGFLRGSNDQTFLRVVGDTRELGNVRYVITLDADTRLPRDAAAKLAGTLAHPLNRARFDDKRNVVTHGYGILQPRVGISMSGQRRSRYARLFGSEPGIDPYTRAVSDVYQDLFGEGSFIGKGIYDVDAFERALDDRMPDNHILSHDLLEGCYARAGLVSDVQLYEDYPARYAVDVKRRHRWIRGDWQLLPWLLPRVPLPGSAGERNPLSMLSRGKLLDNLRRSLFPIAMTALLVMGWTLTISPVAWTAWLLAIVLVPPALASVMDLFNRPADLPLAAHLRQVLTATARNFARAPLTLATLPYEAFFSLDAIVRTLWRMLVSRRRLLQWNPSSEVERTLGDSLPGALLAMWAAPATAAITTVLVLRTQPEALVFAAPILLLWVVSPLLMWWLGRPIQRDRVNLSQAQLNFLGRLARRTFAFFETWVDADNHWLPPDNIQEHPELMVAARTSPTNIGLALLADLSAYDFGYLQQGAMIARTANTLRTLESLERHRGHYFNWYDTTTLQPLPPRYVSTVDSGNLAGHLLTLRQGLLALPDAPVLSASAFRGLVDSFGVLIESKPGIGSEALSSFQETLVAAVAAPPTAPEQALALVETLQVLAQTIVDQQAGQVDNDRIDSGRPDENPTEATFWAAALLRQCMDLRDELHHLLPWLRDDNDAMLPGAFASRLPTLLELATASGSEDGTNQVWVLASSAARARIVELERLAELAHRCAQMDMGFLYDRARHLLTIGYNVDEHRIDPGYYDLLASEARLGNFVAIAQGQLPQESWFALGRLLTEVDGDATLLSWSGSMFEYLMPQLVMPSYEGTLLDQTARHSVQRQIDYGRQRDVPWGVSESGYSLVDARMNYQYRAFGVPGLGLKRGLGQDLVIAPYASMMAAMIAPEAACQNLQRLVGLGFSGRYGMCEAIDYTPSRLPPGQDHAVVQSYMAHHQGMGLLALDYLLREQPMQQRFAADPEFQATLLLLQERIPRTGIFHPHSAEVAAATASGQADEGQVRVVRNPGTTRPALQLLSNGRYHVMLSGAGSGFSRLGDMAVTRWREDATRDHWGNFCFLRDVASGDYWSTSYQPSTVQVQGYEAIFSDAKVEYRGRHRDFETHMEIAVSPEDDIELRRLRVTNRARAARTIEFTTYAEVVLAPGIADQMHPAFSNLFVQTELLRARQAILCTRRPRSHDEVPPWMFHLVAVHDADIDAISYETDRAQFIGRGHSLFDPQALTRDEALSDSEGSVLDPIVAIRCRLTLAPGQTAVVDMVTGVGEARQACEGLIDKYRDRHLGDRVFDLAWTHSQVVRRQINASQADARLYERLAGMVIYASPTLRAEQAILLQNQRGQSGLWGHGISGDHPIVLLRIADAANIDLVRQMVQAHAYWRLKGLAVDLVIWNEDQAGYRQQLQDQILGLIAAGIEAHVIDRPGGIFVRPTQQISHEDRILLQSVARFIVSDGQGSLSEQVARRLPREAMMPLLLPAPSQYELVSSQSQPGDLAALDALLMADPDPWPFERPAEHLILDNGQGSFSADGREYQIHIAEGTDTPAPWCNVLANAQFGSVVSESACGYTWGENAHEFRLTPWHNDPVTDVCGEAFYLRDEETGQYWSPSPLPCRGRGDYRVRHGFGYTVYEHVQDGIASELWVYVAAEEGIKFSLLKLRNLSGRERTLTATGYVEWVLGDLHARTQMHVITEIDADSGVLISRNPYNTEFEGRAAFFDVDMDAVGNPSGEVGKEPAVVRRGYPEGTSFTSDRAEFLGRNGSLRAPVAMVRERLSGKVGAGLDPCAAIQVPVTLVPGESCEVIFRLGCGRSRAETVELAIRQRGVDAAHDALDAVRVHWLQTLGSVQIETPEPSVDVLANGWLLYQTIACRYLARSGFYQSGGAFGFRDQLQDTMAMVHARPDLTRSHLLISAAHQFPQGDVQHWWHPPLDRGVRTHCSDDYLWLPLAVSRYVETTADRAVLDEVVPYIEGRALAADEESYYDLPTRSGLRQDLYQHCVQSLRRGLRLRGERGLPLIASGDWNDGMNRVGAEGRGESVWLGFFLYQALDKFSEVAHLRGDTDFQEECRQAASELRENLDRHAWDGAWYRRAWFDDGTPLGSTTSIDCNIDSIAQSWSVLSGAGDPDRARQAMASLDQHLVRRDAGLIQLLDPPFDRTNKDPGYIRGYVPGVRENGGQYTHAAIWATMAYAELGDRERAWELLRMINPVNHARDAAGVATYKVEPYVVAADVYAVAPHIGRGGWTWYTGSAGWMYRLMIESLLGLRLQGETLRLQPCIPADWPGYTIRYRYRDTVYRIRIRQDVAATRTSLSVNGIVQPGGDIVLRDDRAQHQVEYVIPAAPPPD